MRQIKVTKKFEKKKRLSEWKPYEDYETRFSPYDPQQHHHNRSVSIGNKKPHIRLYTDYADNDNRPSLEKYKKINYSKKRSETQSFTQKYYTENKVQSTKSNPRQNLELRLLFNKGKESEDARSSTKGYNSNHPLMKYVSNRNKEIKKAPYTSEIERFELLYSKIKSSVSKGKKQNNSQTKNKRNMNLSLNKNEIRIKTPLHREREKVEQETVKTVKKTKENEQKHHQSISERSDQASVASIESGYGLTDEEEETYGNRFPYGFEKIKLLGRGGFSLVWLGKHIKSGKQFAIKQIITQNTHQTHIKEIWFGTNFFSLGGVPKPEFSSFPGIKNLVRMYSYEINQSDTWIFYEKCGHSLGSNLYDIKAERVYGEQRLYKIYYKPFYQAMTQNSNLLKTLIIEICKPLVALCNCQIVHSDLKTENILIKYEADERDCYKLTEVKLIDYGSSFEFKNISQFSMATPEYMPPEILNYINHENEGDYEEELYEQVMTNYKNPWAIDIFSLGCVLLEIIVGVPLWMSLPLLVPSTTGASYCQKEGLFAVKGRVFHEIIQKQRKNISRIDEIIRNENFSKIVPTPATLEVIKRMLYIDFNQRISPMEVIELLEAEKIY